MSKSEREKPSEASDIVTSTSTQAAPSDVRKSPVAWWRELMPPGTTGRKLVAYNGAHKTAADVHGWALHQHHSGGQAIQLTREDYLKAIEGANSGKGRAGLHVPALSPYRGKKL